MNPDYVSCFPTYLLIWWGLISLGQGRSPASFYVLPSETKGDNNWKGLGGPLLSQVLTSDC